MARSEGKKEAREGKTPLWPWILLVLLVFLFGGIMLCGDHEEAVIERPRSTAEPEGEYTRVFLLYFADLEMMELMAERRELALHDPSREEVARLLLDELARGPLSEDLIPTLPPQLVIRGIFFDDLGGLYIDLDGRSLSHWEWGSSSELLAIRSMVQTLSGIFPELIRIGFLIDGERVESLGGHVDLLHPFEVAEWR